MGCDVALPMKLRVSEQTRAQREERIAKAQAAASALEPPLVSDDEDADAPTANGGEEEDEDGAVSGEGERVLPLTMRLCSCIPQVRDCSFGRCMLQVCGLPDFAGKLCGVALCCLLWTDLGLHASNGGW